MKRLLVILAFAVGIGFAQTPQNATNGSCPDTLALVPWGYSYPGTGSLIGGAAHGAVIQVFFAPATICFTQIGFTVEVPSGTACTGGICGLGFAVVQLTGGAITAVECISTIAISGGSPDINSTTTKQKYITIASGQAVVSGKCVLPGNFTYGIIPSSDSAVLKLNNYLFGGEPTNLLVGAFSAKYAGSTSGAATSLNGANLTFASASSLNALTWAAAGSATFQLVLAQ